MPSRCVGAKSAKRNIGTSLSTGCSRNVPVAWPKMRASSALACTMMPASLTIIMPFGAASKMISRCRSSACRSVMSTTAMANPRADPVSS
jgi:hypothetical protein